MDIRKEIKAIQAEAENELGFRLVPQFWDIAEQDVGNGADEFDGDPLGQEDYIESYRNVKGRYVELIKLVMPSYKVEPPADASLESNQPKKRHYWKCFKRRFHLVNFVVKRLLNGKSNRIDWRRTVNEWNESNPSDTMSPPVMKVEYYRAIKEPLLMVQVNIVSALKELEPYLRIYRSSDVLSWPRERLEELETRFRKLTRPIVERLGTREYGAVIGSNEFLRDCAIRVIRSLIELNTKQMNISKRLIQRGKLRLQIVEDMANKAMELYNRDEEVYKTIEGLTEILKDAENRLKKIAPAEDVYETMEEWKQMFLSEDAVLALVRERKKLKEVQNEGTHTTERQP